MQLAGVRLSTASCLRPGLIILPSPCCPTQTFLIDLSLQLIRDTRTVLHPHVTLQRRPNYIHNPTCRTFLACAWGVRTPARNVRGKCPYLVWGRLSRQSLQTELTVTVYRQIEGHNARGTRRIKYTNSLDNWLERSTNDTQLLVTTHDRYVYADMVANVIKHGT